MEHVLSWAVLAALHRVTGDGIADSNAILLACPSGEWHTLPLEALRAALAGIAAQMLGASVPAYALAAALKRCTRHATAVLWSQTPTTARGSALRAALAGGARVVAAGPWWTTDTMPDNIFRVRSLRKRYVISGSAERNCM